MGADGGVNAIAVSRLNRPCVEERYKRAIELLHPFYVLWSQSKNSYGDAHDAWLAQNPEYCAPKWLVGNYGTDLHNQSGMETVHDLLRWEDEREQMDVTFSELWLDLRTRPGFIKWKTPSEQESTLLERLMWECFGWQEDQKVESDLASFWTMRVRDWFEELKQLLNTSSYFSVETWT